MRSVLKHLPIGVALFALALAASLPPTRVHSAPSGGTSLLQTLSEWKYPGADHTTGPSMSDAGLAPMQAFKCEAILTTPDPIDEVVAFYVEKLGKVPENTVSVQKDYEGRTVTLCVIVVNRVDPSTTLVIHRADGEKETHIAWSHFIRLAAGDHQIKGADDRMRISLCIYSGRRDPGWEAGDGEGKHFSARFDALKAREVQEPLNPVLGYRGFLVHGFRSYDRIWVWNGTVEATRDGKSYQWEDEGRTLEKHLLEAARGHVSDEEFKMAADSVEGR